jgi:hypothetical protein
LNGKYNIIKDGKTLLDNWYDDVDVDPNENIIITNNGKKAIFNLCKGNRNKILSWFDEIKEIYGNKKLAIVVNNGMYFIFDINVQITIIFRYTNDVFRYEHGFNKINIINDRYAECINENNNFKSYNFIDLEKKIIILPNYTDNEFQAKFRFAKYLYENNEYDKEKYRWIYLYI